MIEVVFGGVQHFGVKNDYHVNGKDFDFRLQLVSNQIHCAGLFRRSSCINIGGYDEELTQGYEDWEFYIRLLSQAGKAVECKEITLFYRRKFVSRSTEIGELNVGGELENYIFSKNYFSKKFFKL